MMRPELIRPLGRLIRPFVGAHSTKTTFGRMGSECLNLKKVDTFGSNTERRNETQNKDTTSVH